MQKIDANLFDEIVYDDGEPCLVMFHRKTCHVCQSVKPMLEELEAEFEGKFGFYDVDVEEQKELFQRFSLKGVPQVLFFDDGELVDKLAGGKEEEDYIEKIESIVG